MDLLLHETEHQWAAHAGDVVLENNPKNLNLVNLGIREMGGHYFGGLNSPEGTLDPLGAMYWEKIPSNSLFTNNNRNNYSLKYHPFTLYFMGILPENKYDVKFDLLHNEVSYRISPVESVTAMESVYKQVSVRDIIDKEGPRVCSTDYSLPPVQVNTSPATATSPNVVVPSVSIKIGTKGVEVKNLQNFLGIKSDGIYGKGTVTAVKNWQLENNLVGDGVFGPKSIKKMQEMSDVR